MDEKRYIASSSTFYRVLREKDMLHHRKKGRARKKLNPPPELAATGPNQVWSWDITYLKTEIKGIYLYAYIIIDVWSRKITGWEIHEEESETIARELFERLKGRYNLSGIKLHSDNGNPMKGATMIMTLYNLGVIPSFSRPRISDDNPYSESLFKTLKYTAGFPGCFKNLNHSREWIADFVNWYNEKHRHSGIKYITPNQRHSGLGEKIMMIRNQVIAEAFSQNPQRWSHKPALWKNLETVYLNPSAETKNNNAA